MLRTASNGLLAVIDGASITAAADVVILPDRPLTGLAGSQVFSQRFAVELLRCTSVMGEVALTRRAMHPNRAGCTGLQRQQRRTK